MFDFKEDITSAIVAAKGSGKSVMLASMLNELEQGILIDTIGVFNPRSEFKTAVIPDSTYFTNPALFIEFVRKNSKVPKKTVINFGDLVGEEITENADILFSFIYQNVPHMPILLDEIADIMPLLGVGSSEFHRLVKNGRNHGNKPVIFATQRPQNMSKQVFDLCDNFYLSMQRAPRTIDYIIDLMDKKGDENIKQEIKNLQPRHFLKYNGVETINVEVPKYKYAFKQ
jgi:hypothetical protein